VKRSNGAESAITAATEQGWWGKHLGAKRRFLSVILVRKTCNVSEVGRWSNASKLGPTTDDFSLFLAVVRCFSCSSLQEIIPALSEGQCFRFGVTTFGGVIEHARICFNTTRIGLLGLT